MGRDYLLDLSKLSLPLVVVPGAAKVSLAATINASLDWSHTVGSLHLALEYAHSFQCC